jgi:CIC family chloride channel protein
MMTVGIATMLSQKMLKGESIYTLKLTRRGVRLQRGRDVDIMESVTVEEVMSRDFDSVACNVSLEELANFFGETHRHGFPMLNQEGELCGIVTIGDLDRALEAHLPPDTPARQIGTPGSDLIVVTPDVSMGEALARMGIRGMGRLPVVDPENAKHLLGVVRRDDITRAYNLALSRRADLQYRAQRQSLSNIDGTIFSEIVLDPTSPVIGKRLSELSPSFPEQCILVSVRRGSRLLIPHGDTVFQAGDRVTVFVNARDVDEIKACLRGVPDDDEVAKDNEDNNVSKQDG